MVDAGVQRLRAGADAVLRINGQDIRADTAEIPSGCAAGCGDVELMAAGIETARKCSGREMGAAAGGRESAVNLYIGAGGQAHIVAIDQAIACGAAAGCAEGGGDVGCADG